MMIKQIRLSKMATFCYLVADPKTRDGALIDPAFDTPRLLNLIDAERITVTHVINTHAHPDHTAGNRAILNRIDARLAIHHLDAERLKGFWHRIGANALGGAGSPAPDILLHDGDDLQVGELSVRVIHTPGHTPGSVCLYAEGHLFSGDTLFVGAVGRTDLPGGDSERMIASIRQRLLALADDTTVWPGHDYGPAPTSTIGRERVSNPFLH